MDKQFKHELIEILDNRIEAKVPSIVRRVVVEVFDEQFENRFILLFNRGCEEVIFPMLERMEQKIRGDFSKRIAILQAQLDRLDRKVDLMAERQLEQSSKLVEYDRRIGKLERKRIAA